MRPVMRSIGAAVIAALLSGCSPSPHPAPRRPGGTAGEIRLAIVIVADGLSWPILDRHREVYTSGLKRLLEDGRVESACRYRHTVTETGPGHASIATGAPPRLHGIVGNEWWGEEEGGWRKVYCADEPGRRGVRGAGHLAVPTLGDRLLQAYPGARVVTIAGKDRAAILLAGRDSRHAPFWYDSKTGTFVTSPVYDSASPAGAAGGAVVAAFNAERGGAAIEARHGRIWSRSAGDRPALEPEGGLEGAQHAAVGLGFDHDLGAATGGFVRGLMWSPVADAILAELAVALLENDDLAFGRRGIPDLLAVSFSGLDYVSHAYGNESEEAFELLRHLDLAIGRVLETAERRVGPGRVIVALTADHGFSPFPETLRRRDPGTVAARIDTEAIRSRINAELVRWWNLPAEAAPVAEFDGFTLVWDRSELARLSEAIPQPTDRGRDGVLAAAAMVALGSSAEYACPASGGCEPPWDVFAMEAYFPGRSPDVYVFPRPGVIPDWWTGKGSTHGSHHDYDTHVPLLFWGPGFERGVSTAPSTPYDLAPALARRLDLDVPEPPF